MKHFALVVVSSILAFVFSLTPVFAAQKPSSNDTSEPIGYDISYPQCNGKMPSPIAFAIIGVNGGTAASTNTCLAAQLSWAKKAVTNNQTKQPNLQLYINTANPGEQIDSIMTWPTSSIDRFGNVTPSPYGMCTGLNDLACSWQYGWSRAEEDLIDRFIPAAQKAGISTAASDYTWWLDIETTNTWQSGSSDALNRNLATLEGMAAYLTNPSRNAKLGLYSTSVQWNEIIGDTQSPSLAGLPNWRPSGSTLKNAINNCKSTSLTTGGFVAMTQYIQGGIDKNHSCL